MERAHRAGHGGICGLIALLDEHYEAVEADLAHYYQPGDQLPDLWAGTLSFRRFWVLCDHLPPQSATKTLLMARPHPVTSEPETPAGPVPFSHEMHLLATLRDDVRIGFWQLLTAQGAKVPAPKPTPRPGLAPVVDIDIARRNRDYLERIRAGHGTPI